MCGSGYQETEVFREREDREAKRTHRSSAEKQRFRKGEKGLQLRQRERSPCPRPSTTLRLVEKKQKKEIPSYPPVFRE